MGALGVAGLIGLVAALLLPRHFVAAVSEPQPDQEISPATSPA
jgi:hypothetical protein